jgi:hypothetical protein
MGSPLASTTRLNSTKKVILGPKDMRTQCVPITCLTGSMSAQLMNPTNVCGARFYFGAVIDHCLM